MKRTWLLLCATLVGCGGVDERVPAGGNSGLRYLGGAADPAFARVLEPREFVFPADHGSHPEYQTEWWYFTGNVVSGEGRHFGFDLTFFRYALASGALDSDSGSRWRTRQAWMAHFALTDTAGGRFLTAERLGREALGLAGATGPPLQVWVHDWSLEAVESGQGLDLKLEASDASMGLSLDLTSTVAPVAQGENGFSRKGAAAGNASYYYSLPRLEAQGSVSIGGETFAVQGLAWMDREWGTSSLEPGVAGWDWFALHLADGGSLMFYRLRTVAGQANPFSAGSWVDAAGVRTALGADDVALEELRHWRSPATGAEYPVVWRMAIPKAGVVLVIEPYLEAQELDLSVRYWEGAVHAGGTGANGRVTAQGYVELTGY